MDIEEMTLQAFQSEAALLSGSSRRLPALEVLFHQERERNLGKDGVVVRWRVARAVDSPKNITFLL